MITRMRPGRHGDGGTLFLVVEAPPSKSRHWVQRLTVHGTRRDIGLGGWPFVTLAEARDQAFENRRLARRGGDPVARAVTVPTFRAAALAVEQGSAWAALSRQNRRTALAMYCGALLDRPVNQIGRADALRVLVPLYREKAATGRRLRGWLRGVLAWGQAHGYIEGPNVAGEMIDAALPTNGNGAQHRAALAYRDVPAALERIATGEASPAAKACLRFIAVTAVRSGEARGATWAEIDLTAGAWKIPAERMKAGREHRVPLSREAVEVLEFMRPLRGASDLIFPGVGGKVIYASALLRVFHRMTGREDASVHGLRSAFRTWAAEVGNTTRDLAEQALAHVVGSEIERSYQRGDLFERRRLVMAEWAAFCCCR